MSYFMCLDYTKDIRERQYIKSQHKGKECIFSKARNRLFKSLSTSWKFQSYKSSFVPYKSIQELCQQDKINWKANWVISTFSGFLKALKHTRNSRQCLSMNSISHLWDKTLMLSTKGCSLQNPTPWDERRGKGQNRNCGWNQVRGFNFMIMLTV